MKVIILIVLCLFLLGGCSSFRAKYYCNSIGYEEAQFTDLFDMEFYCYTENKLKSPIITKETYNKLQKCYTSDCCDMKDIEIKYLQEGNCIDKGE